MYKALKRCDLPKGETVGIVGCGGGLGTFSHERRLMAGHLGLQFAKHLGYHVVGGQSLFAHGVDGSGKSGRGVESCKVA